CTACVRNSPARCDGNNLLTCRNDESGFDTKACGEAGCDPARRACRLCKPSAVLRCEGTTQISCNADGTAEVAEPCKCGGAECTPGQQSACGPSTCGGSRTCQSTCKWEECPVSAVRDEWTTKDYPDGALHATSAPWKVIHGGITGGLPISNDGSLTITGDDILTRNAYKSGYVISLDILPSTNFAAHFAIGADAPYPALYREGTGANRDGFGPIKLGGMKYGISETFQMFGSWTGQTTLDGRITLYVKRSGDVAVISRFGPLRSGWVKYPATKPELLHLVGSNSGIVSSDGTAKVSTIVGCQGLSDAQVEAQYNAGKMH
ncbi:MAG TPA: hypothetical protein VGF45_07880, partial [Polyangia bacterium]